MESSPDGILVVRNNRIEFLNPAAVRLFGATHAGDIAGKSPFEAKNLVETIAQIRQADPVPPKKFQLSIPDQLQDAVMLMLAKRPELRYQTPTEAARALERIAKFQGMVIESE